MCFENTFLLLFSLFCFFTLESVYKPVFMISSDGLLRVTTVPSDSTQAVEMLALFLAFLSLASIAGVLFKFVTADGILFLVPFLSPYLPSVLCILAAYGFYFSQGRCCICLCISIHVTHVFCTVYTILNFLIF